MSQIQEVALIACKVFVKMTATHKRLGSNYSAATNSSIA